MDFLSIAVKFIQSLKSVLSNSDTHIFVRTLAIFTVIFIVIFMSKSLKQFCKYSLSIISRSLQHETLFAALIGCVRITGFQHN